MIRPAFAFLAVALTLAACARSEEASLVPPEGAQGYNRVGTVRSPEQDDREPAIGQWRGALQEDRPALEFGPIGTEPLFSLLCAPGGGVLLQRHGGVPAGALPAMQATVGEVAETLPVTPGGAAVPLLRAELAAGSPTFAALATGGQPLLVRLDDSAPLVLPPSPLVTDYLRGCGRTPPTGQIGNQARNPTGNQAAPMLPPANPAAAAPPPAPANTAAASNGAAPRQ